MVFSGTATKYLAERICQSLGCPLGKMVMTKFSDGEFAVSYEQSVRGRDLFLVQSTFPNSDCCQARFGKVDQRRDSVLRMGSSRP